MFIIIIVIMLIISIVIINFYRVKQRWDDTCIFIMHNAAFTHFSLYISRHPVSSYLKYFEWHFTVVLG